MFEFQLARLADDGSGLYAGVGADAVEFEGREHVELFLVLHGVVDGDNRCGHCLIADINHQRVAYLDSASGGPADYIEIIG